MHQLLLHAPVDPAPGQLTQGVLRGRQDLLPDERRGGDQEGPDQLAPRR